MSDGESLESRTGEPGDGNNTEDVADNARDAEVWDLRAISTQWSAVSNANLFVLRYVDAIRNYLEHLLPNTDDVEDVLQQFLVRVIERGFVAATPDRGRFRHYLIRSIRNEVATWYRERTRRRGVALDSVAQSFLSIDDTDSVSQRWHQEWQAVLLERCWLRLSAREMESEGSLCHTVLRHAMDHPKYSSEESARELSQRTGQTISAAAYRKQLSRARRLFAESIAREVSDTLTAPTPEAVCEELAETGLMPFVADHLPADWK